MEHHTHTHTSAAETFPTDVAGLPAARATEVVSLDDGELFELSIEPVSKQIGDDMVRMLGYNGQVPGPTLRVPEGAEIQVKVENRGDLDATVHWHGLRLDNAYDGTHETQKPMAVGESFTYRVACPDPGAYWYHPHIREDYGQELGLYGNLIVCPADPDYWGPAHRELAITLDDILIEDGKVAPFFREDTTYAAMGRFGNVMLAGGQTDLQLSAKRGEVVRLFLTNTANTRVFNVGVAGARMKLVGGDSGRCERETFVESVVLAPSERVVVDVLFDSGGEAVLEHRTPDTTYRMATVTVKGETSDPAPALAFDTLRENAEFAALREQIAAKRTAEPDKSLAFVAEMDFEEPEGAVIYVCPMHPEVISETEGSCPECGMKLMPQAAPVAYTCPMHPEVVSAEQGKCPDCGMKLMPAAHIYTCPMHPAVLSSEQGKCPDCGMKLMPTAGIYVCPMHPEVLSSEQGKCPDCGMKLMPASMVSSASHGHGEHHDMERHAHAEVDHGEHEAHAGHHDHGHAGGIEWEDDMVEVNKTTTPANTRWKLIDRASGAENHGINWQFKVGDWVKIELVNEMDSDHPMHHPFHVHGAGRFLVLDRDGVEDDNLVWKDTVLIRTAERVNILLEVTNVGRWMAHCHIAEHHESGMMFSFEVTE
jgi:FtsP/CotA-like multicopper oxidase with cupredoxin domain